MSVCIIHKSNYDILITAAIKRGVIPAASGPAYAAKLYQTNVDAYNYRYASSPRVAAPVYKFEMAERADADVREALEHYLYNCNELPGFEKTEAVKFLRSLFIVTFG